LTHFRWRNRTTNGVDDDFVLFDGDATFKRIKQFKDGRIVMLEFKESGKREFYWLQDEKEDKDDSNVQSVNKHLNPSSSNV